MVKLNKDFLFDSIVVLLLTIIALICIIPMLYVLSMSITPFSEVQRNGGFVLVPRAVTFEAYRNLLTGNNIQNAFRISLFITIVGTTMNLLVTILMAYPLSRKNLLGRNWMTNVIIFTMMFNGGMIPTYLIVKSLGLIDKVMALILPQLVWSFNLLIIKNFFQSISEELIESMRIDGAGDWRVLFTLVLPLSMPVLMTVGLYYAVGHWNQYFQSVLYITTRSLRPIQAVVREILALSNNPLNEATEIVPTITMQMASIMIAAIPILAVYPFVQRFFVKGVMLGALKG